MSNNNNNKIQEDLTTLQKEMLGVQYVLTSQGEILKEVKDVLVKQSETLDKVAEVQKDLSYVKSDMDTFKVEFYNRRDKTDKNNLEFNSFISYIKGGLVVGLFCFGLIQGFFAWEFNRAFDKLKNIERNVIQNKMHISEIKSKDKFNNK